MTIRAAAVLGRRSDNQDAMRRLTLDALSVTFEQRCLEDVRRLEPRGCADWLRFAVHNGVGPIIAHRLLDALGGDHPDADTWRGIHDAAQRRMAAMMGQLDAVAERLSAEGIRLVALKNAGIARGVYPCAACCPMGDVDVLIERSRFADAHALLLEQGFELASRSTVEPADIAHGAVSGGSEYRVEVDGVEVWLELQWRPVAGRWLRGDQEPDGAELLARSVPISGSAVRLLAPEDNMLQVCLHTAKHSFVRAPGLRLHTDVDRLSHLAPPDWEAVVDLARRLEVTTASYFSLALSHALLGAAVPEGVLARLSPAGWKEALVVTWLRRLDVFEPDERKFNRPGMLLFHALLYDNWPALLASLFDTDRRHLGLRDAPRNLRRGAARIYDLLTRYEA